MRVGASGQAAVARTWSTRLFQAEGVTINTGPVRQLAVPDGNDAVSRRMARLSQLVLPAMREAERGRIVNVGSMGGRLVFPVGGYYHASKYAVEALTDALRFEAAPFGIRVSLIEPGLIRTEFGGTAARTLAGSAAPGSPYAGLNEATDRQMARSYRSRALSAPAEAVARVIERAATGARPRTRYVVTPAARLLVQSRRLLGAGLFDAYLRRQFRPAT